MAKAETEVREVQMDDGTIVSFAGKARIKKSTLKADDGSLALRVDFENGEWRLFKLNPALLADYALHGASQKFGDEVAGLKAEDGTPAPIEDFIQAMEELDARVNGKGEWTTTREGGAVAGGSLLAKAMEQVTGQSAEKVREFLSSLTPKEKAALKKEPEIFAVVQQLEAARNAKAAAKAGSESILSKFKIV